MLVTDWHVMEEKEALTVVFQPHQALINAKDKQLIVQALDVLTMFADHWDLGQADNITLIVEIKKLELVMMEINVPLIHANQLSLQLHAQMQLVQLITLVVILFQSLVMITMHALKTFVPLQLDVISPNQSQLLHQQHVSIGHVIQQKEMSEL